MSSVLVVEDERAVRHLVEKILQSAGFTVVAAADGQQALQELERGSFDLVLTDVWMPKMNGLELLARLRSQPGAPRVVVMTADDTPETLLRVVREQAHQYISKPFEAQELVELLNSVLRSPAEMLPIEVLSAQPHWVELLVPCDLKTVERIQLFLAHLDADLDPEVRESVGRAFRELLLNAVEWGGECDPRRKVRIAYLRARRMLLYRIADPGPGFKEEALRNSALHNPPDRPFQHLPRREEKGLRPGGFGILLVQALVDELLYNEARNEVVFVKYLE